MTIRPHPVMIKNYLTRYLILLIIPTARGIIGFFATGAFTKTVAWYTVSVIIILIISLLKLLSCKIRIYDSEIKAFYGLFFRRELDIRFKRISSVSFNRGAFMHMLKAVSVKIDTEAGSGKKSDFEIILSEKNTKVIEDKIYGKPEKTAEFHVNFFKACITALSAASFFASAVLAVSVINQIGKIIADDVASRIYQGITDAAAVLDFLLPRAVSIFAAVILLGFAISFVYTVFRYAHFIVRREYNRGGAVISVQSGLLTKRTLKFSEASVNALFILARPFIKILRLNSISLCVAGFGKSRQEISVLFPAVEKKNSLNIAKSLFPDISYYPPNIKTPKRSVERFIFPQTVMLLLSPVLAYIISPFAGRYENEIFITLLICMAVIAAWLTSKNSIARVSGIYIGSTVCFCTIKGMTEVKGVIPKERVSAIKISQTPFDRIHGLCSVSICVLSKRAPHYKVRNLDYSEVCRTFRSYFE